MDLLDKHEFPFPASFPCNASTFTKVFISATIFRKTPEELSFFKLRFKPSTGLDDATNPYGWPTQLPDDENRARVFG